MGLTFSFVVVAQFVMLPGLLLQELLSSPDHLDEAGLTQSVSALTARQYSYWRWIPWKDFYFTGKTAWKYMSINNVINKMLTAKFSTISILIRTLNSPILTNNRIVESGNMGSFVAVHWSGDCRFSMLDSHSLSRETLIMSSRPNLVCKRQVSGWSCCKLVQNSMATLWTLTLVGVSQ